MIVSSCRSTCTGLLWAVIKILIGLTAMAFAPAYADTITLNFTMAMVWQYNLGTSTFDSIQPLTMDVQAVIDDQVTGTIVFSPDTIRTNFGAARIDSPLSGLIDLGYDVSTLAYSTSGMSAQGNNGSFNETWLTISEELSGSGYDWEKSLENNDVPPMTDPANFTTADLESLLFSEVGVSGLWSYREDIDYPGGGGLQNYFSAVLDSVSVDDAVPEPSYEAAIVILVGAGALYLRRRTISSR